MSYEFEVFTECPDYPDLFMIGNFGTLFSIRTFQDLALTPNHNGYLTHASKIGGRKGKSFCLRAHVQVAKAFVPNPLNLPFVNHKDTDKTNNRWDNLEWVTHQGNIDHAQALGLYEGKKGFDSPHAALDEESVKAILELVGTMSYRAIAREFEIGKDTVRRVALGIRYNGI